MLQVVPILILSMAAAAPGGAAAPPAPPPRACHLEPAGGDVELMAVRLAFFASRLGVPPAFALAVAHHESLFNPAAISPKGAIGVMQIMPGTAIEYDTDEDALHDPDVNMYTGLRILRDLLLQFDGREPLAAAAYIAGPAFWTRQYPASVGREIEDYVARVMELTDAYSVAVSCD